MPSPSSAAQRSMDNAPILDRALTDVDRGLPRPPPGAKIGNVGSLGWALEDLLPPVAVIKESAVANNLAVMAEYCRSRGLELAPHAKTTMAPQLVARQLEHGAWGMTVGTVFQARVLAGFGARRMIIAHQVTDRVGIDEVAQLLAAHPDLELHVLADSVAGVEAMDRGLRRARIASPLNVLVELGVPGGRTGCRSTTALIEVARAVDGTRTMRVAGVEGYEGLADRGSLDQALPAVDEFLDRLLAAATVLQESPFAVGPMVLSAGGSAYFDRVADRFASAGPDVLRVLRSGCYVTHDHGKYHRLSPLDGRAAGRPSLLPALEVWAAVVSRPEPDLLILNAGRRDMSFDAGLPMVVKRKPAGATSIEDLTEWWPAERLMDQHAMVRVPPDAPAGPGDLVGLGISHPCTTFDKWQVIPVIDDAYGVVDAIVTYF